MSKHKGKDSQVLPWHGIVTVPLSSGVGSVNLNPNSLNGAGISRPLAEADGWCHFQHIRLAFCIHHGSLTADVAVGVVGGAQDTPPATKNTVMELLPSAYQGSTYTEPSRTVQVSHADLAGPIPWYKTVPGAADSTEEIPCQLVIAGAGTDTVVVELWGEMRFKTAASPANTPLSNAARETLRRERIEAERVQARDALLRVLGIQALGDPATARFVSGFGAITGAKFVP